MFEPPELPQADELHKRAGALSHRALDYALAAEITDTAALRLGVDTANPFLMSYPPSDEVFEKCVAVCERALAAAEAGDPKDPEVLALGVQAAQLVNTLRGMSGNLDLPHGGIVVTDHVGFGAFHMEPPSQQDLMEASDLRLTSAEHSDWLIGDEGPSSA